MVISRPPGSKLLDFEGWGIGRGSIPMREKDEMGYRSSWGVAAFICSPSYCSSIHHCYKAEITLGNSEEKF